MSGDSSARTKGDRDRWLRILPLAVGALVGTGLMINRLFTPQLLPSQARSDIAGVIACAVLILTGMLWQRVQPKIPDSVALVGIEGMEMSSDLSPSWQTELAWASHLLLTNTVTRSIVVYYQGQTIFRRGVLAPVAAVVPGVIVERVLKIHQPIYLVNLNIYPGRIEFNYLPENTQGVICQPIGEQGVLILAANAPRSYTQQDEVWIAGIADKLAHTLSNPDLI
jgi:Cofactor assembly of complex C subunit B, CCB2/CCB4